MIKLSGMRLELIDYLRGLSDPEYQVKCWVNGDFPEGVEHDELDYAVHFFFDDTGLSSDAQGLVGWVLKDQCEAHLISKLCRELEAVFDKYGTELEDSEYISCPEWERVIRAARSAYEETRDGGVG